MITVAEATRTILSHPWQPNLSVVSLTSAIDHVLAEAIYADRDFPPFNRVMMDGIAVAYATLQQGRRAFHIEAVQPAGVPQVVLKDVNNCIEVMTGAVLPAGTDVVIRYEDLAIKDGIATVMTDTFQPMQQVHLRGTDAKKGDELLPTGMRMSPAEIALLASVGKTEVMIRQLPRIAIVSTGNELVEVGDMPALHQIRRSNSYALLAAINQAGATAMLHHLPDDEQETEQGIAQILATVDVLILSGGVSKGRFDFVPVALERLGVQKLFHQVSQRPGKPFWFGVAATDNKTVFALPGNPVSTYLCFYRYIKPWLLQSMGVPRSFPTARLAADFTFQPNITYFLQVKTAIESGCLMATPIPGGGSGDFANLAGADGFIELPAEQTNFKAGEVFPYISFREY